MLYRNDDIPERRSILLWIENFMASSLELKTNLSGWPLISRTLDDGKLLKKSKKDMANISHHLEDDIFKTK